MKLPGYYSSGQFAKLAGVSVRTIRFYDKQNILKPSYIHPNGARFYTDSDLARLQQILLLKYLGFSLDEIREITITDTDYRPLLHSLRLQQRLIQDRMEQMRLVENAIESTDAALEQEHQIDWSRMLHLIHLTGMEKSLASQYRDASNISARIRLHRDYSQNRQGWFPWIYSQCRIRENMRILELGCGNGALWAENRDRLPAGVQILLSDISEGMLRDARRTIGEDSRFSFRSFDCHEIPCEAGSFDLVIANHVLFYCHDIPQVCREAARVLKPDGTFVCSTYGASHMKEISELVQAFDSRIVLAAENLSEHFGLENGAQLLGSSFPCITCIRYPDSIELDCAEPLIAYILSCHGNQNRYLLDRYKDFKAFVEQKTKKGFHITKDAGIFICRSQRETAPEKKDGKK